jgi:hypothetical protein
MVSQRYTDDDGEREVVGGEREVKRAKLNDPNLI